jgi:hypothetical protein
MRNRGYPRRSGYLRESHDFYVEPRWCIELLLDVEAFEGAVLDPCCGIGTIVSACCTRGISARGSDIVGRGFGDTCDLFTLTETVDNIISNVPYHLAEACVRHLLSLVRFKLALILPLTFWESRQRNALFREHPPVRFYPCSDRPSMPPGRSDGPRDCFGAVIQPENRGGTAPYGWFVWERGFAGATIVRMLPLRPAGARR